MTLNERLLDFLDGSLGADDEAELLHTLSVSPEKRDLLRSFMNDDALLARDRQALQIPYEAERGLWAKVDTFLPLAEPAESILPIAMQSASIPAVGSMVSRFATATVAAIALFIGLGSGFVAGSSSTPSASLTNNHQRAAVAPPAAVGPQNVAPSTERIVIRNVWHDRYIASNNILSTASPLLLHDLLIVPSLSDARTHVRDIREEVPSEPNISSIDGRTFELAMPDHIGGEGGNTPMFVAAMSSEKQKSILQRFEFSIDESFGRQFPNSVATNVSIPLLTNSSLGAFFQVLPQSNLVWAGAAYGTANVTRKNLFTRAGNQTDPLQEVLASDTVHSQTSYLAGYLQLRFPAFPSADLTFTAGYGIATLGQMMMGEIGLHYDVAREVGVNLGLRLLRFSYDLSGDKAAAIASGNGSLVVPSAVAAASPSFNTELTTGLYFHF